MRNPVHRKSRLKGSFETGFYPKYERGYAFLIMEAAEKYDRRLKKRGRKIGALGDTGLSVLRELTRFINYATGQIDPALKTIAERCRLSKQTVVDALKRLSDAGFVRWIRRIVYVDQRTLFGQVVAQTSNAYALDIPEAATTRSHAPASPPPDDEATRKADLVARLRDMETLERDDALKKAGVIRTRPR